MIEPIIGMVSTILYLLPQLEITRLVSRLQDIINKGVRLNRLGCKKIQLRNNRFLNKNDKNQVVKLLLAFRWIYLTSYYKENEISILCIWKSSIDLKISF